MNLRSTWADLYGIAHRFGIAAVATESLSRLFGRLCDGRCHVVIVLTSAGLPAVEPAPSADMAPRFLRAEEVAATAAQDPELFDETFAAAALARGDECVACFDGARVVSTSWYTVHPSQLSNGLWVTFDARYIYSYKGQTLTHFRGKRLAGQRGAFVRRSFAARGYAGIMAEIEINNFSSLRNAARLGARRVGTFVTWRMFGQYRSVTNRGCRSYGFKVSRSQGDPAAR
jgi:hypothetical protein